MKYKKINILNNKKIACFTLDFENDYGSRINEFNIFNEKKQLQELINLFEDLNLPVSSFIQTNLLDNKKDILSLLKDISCDFHAHSHTHNVKNFLSRREIFQCYDVFQKNFKSPPLGYRAPQGVLYKNDLDLIKEAGFKFSSSIFPSLRPGKFNNLSYPLTPIKYKNGIIELPFAAYPFLRYPFTISYIKLLGFSINKLLMKAIKFSNIIVIDSHLHDFIVSDKSYNKLPFFIKYAYSINKYNGMRYLKKTIEFLKERNYEFVTITELYKIVAKENKSG